MPSQRIAAVPSRSRPPALPPGAPWTPRWGCGEARTTRAPETTRARQSRPRPPRPAIRATSSIPHPDAGPSLRRRRRRARLQRPLARVRARSALPKEGSTPISQRVHPMHTTTYLILLGGALLPSSVTRTPTSIEATPVPATAPDVGSTEIYCPASVNSSSTSLTMRPASRMYDSSESDLRPDPSSPLVLLSWAGDQSVLTTTLT